MATITDRYQDPASFTDMLQTIGLAASERNRIINDGFTTMETFVNHFKSGGPKEVSKYLKDLNKTFGNSTVAGRRVYYTPVVLNRIVGVSFYFILAVHSLHSIPDITSITANLASQYGDRHKDFEAMSDSDLGDDAPTEVTLPILKGSSNWVEWKEKFSLRLAHSFGKRGSPLSYVIDQTDRAVTRANARLLEVPSIDFSDLTILKTSTTHFGPAFKEDNRKVWSILESNLVNTMPFNHVAAFSDAKNGMFNGHRRKESQVLRRGPKQ